jgi:hypothetical protein
MEFGLLTRLQQLYLNDNRFVHFPEILLRLELDYLYLAGNRLKRFPSLNKLRVLDLSRNQIVRLPLGLQMEIRVLVLSGNPMRSQTIGCHIMRTDSTPTARSFAIEYVTPWLPTVTPMEVINSKIHTFMSFG